MPRQMPTGVGAWSSTRKELAEADAVMVLTDHDAFDYDLVAGSAPYVLDTRNRCRGPQCRAALTPPR